MVVINCLCFSWKPSSHIAFDVSGHSFHINLYVASFFSTPYAEGAGVGSLVPHAPPGNKPIDGGEENELPNFASEAKRLIFQNIKRLSKRMI